MIAQLPTAILGSPQKWLRHRLIVLLQASLLSGCAVGPDFKPPSAPAVDGYTQEKNPASTIASTAETGRGQAFVKGRDLPGEWWKLFHSKRIDSLMAEAIRNHPDIMAGQAALRAARENANAERGALLPQATLDVNQARDGVTAAENGQKGDGSVFNLSKASTTVSFDPDVFGGERRTIEGLDAQAEYARWQLEATQLALTANLATTLILDASLRAQIAATQQIIRSESEQLDLLQKRFHLGAVAETDVLLQEANLDQTKATLPPLEKSLAQNRNQLMAYLGRLPSEDRGESVELSQLNLPGQLPLSLPSALVRQRPDVLAAEETLRQANAQIGVATANMLPKFSLSATFGSAALSPGALFGPQAAAWSLAAGATQPLFKGGSLLHSREAAIASRDQDAAQYRSTVLKAFQNVADSLRAIQYDAKALAAQAETERTSARSLAISRSQFQTGGTTWTSVLTAEQTYQNAVIARVKAQAQRFADTTALFQSLGGGWWNRVDETQQAQPRSLSTIIEAHGD